MRAGKQRAPKHLSLIDAAVLCALLLGSLLLVQPGLAQTQGRETAPKVRKPSFPLEPDKKPSQPVRPETYREGPTEPPLSEADREMIPRLNQNPDHWWSLMEVGWLYMSQSAQHLFSGSSAVPQLGSVRKNNHNILGLMARFETRPPIGFVSFVATGSASWGTAEVGKPLSIENITRFNAQDYRAAGGVRFHPFRRSSKHDVSLGADIGLVISSYATLTPDLALSDVDLRNIIHLTPRIMYRLSPSPNWTAEVTGGYLVPLSTSGTGDVRSDDLMRIDAEIAAVRYLEPADAIRFGIGYSYEKANWQQSVPFTLMDSMRSRDLRLLVSWRHDL